MKKVIYFGKKFYECHDSNIKGIRYEAGAEIKEVVGIHARDYCPPQNKINAMTKGAIEINGTMYGRAGEERIKGILIISAY